MCCSGNTQTTKITATLLWRIDINSVERKLIINLTGTNGEWTGEASGSYEMGNGPVPACGGSKVIGSQVLRIKGKLTCSTIRGISYIQGLLTVTFLQTIFKVRLDPVAIACTGSNLTASWDQLFLGQLGIGQLSVAGS